ncbi:MAG: hypothetical protein NC548_24240 [Lachnospiraceae bacterium]|nr:hypothetical protein [Lachnospiraceae bacterium]
MKKQIFCGVIFLVGFCMALCHTGSLKAYAKEDGSFFLRGGGTKYNPYLVSSYEDIVKLRDAVDSGNRFDGVYFRQTEDISFPDGINWNPIGSLDDLNYAFAGVYDGNGYTLSNIYSEDQYAGVFSLLAGEVRNLGIESGYFQGSWAGSITSCGTETAKIINCYNKADVRGEARAGGIMDDFSGRAYFCWNLGDVTGGSEGMVTAGIASFGAADISYCYAAGADQLVSDAAFTGEITDSRLIEEQEIEDCVQQSYEDMFAVYSGDKDLVARGNIVFMVCEDGELHFDKAYEPEVFLAEKQEERARFQEVFASRYQFAGKGTEEEPFLISSYEDLVRLRDCVDIGVNYAGYYFEQTEDLYFPEGINWDPIGDSENAFAGVYDGGGHIIANIYCDNSNAGVFSRLAGEVRNLGIESGMFCGAYIGSITSHGTTEAKIINCYNKANVEGNGRAGGLADNFPGEILFSWNFGEVSGEQDTVLAGICSYGSPKIRYCYSTAEAEPVNPKTFHGELYESGRIESADVRRRLRQNEKAYGEAIRDEVLKADDTLFLNVVGSDQLGFDQEYIPAEVMGAERMGYLMESILLEIAVLLGIIMLIVRHRYRKCGESDAKAKKEEESDEQEQLAIDRKVSWKNSGKTIRERAVAVMLTVAIFLLGFSYVMGVCKTEWPAGVLNLEYWEKAENRNTDVLLVGASSMSVNTEIGELWKEKGIAAYCIGGGAAKLWDSYYRLLEGDKRHSCQLIVMEMRGASLGADAGSEERLSNIVGLKLSYNKLRYINATVEPQERMYYILNFPLYHSRYYALTKWDFLHASILGNDDKGTWTIFYDSKDMYTLEPAVDVVGYRAINQKQEYYLRRIIEYCAENDRELLLLKTPDGYRTLDQPFYNTVTLIAEEYGVPFLDMNYYDEEIGLTSADFSIDNAHLNVKGARKCTAFLGDYLTNHYTFPDHRGDAAYASWDRFAANREDLYLRAITDNNDYFDELLRDKRKIIAIPCGMSQEKSEQYVSVKEKLDACEYELYDAEDVRYGEENQNSWTLGSNTVTVQKDYQARRICINEKTKLSVESPGVILIVYDEVTDQIADVAAFTSANGFSVQHLYAGGDD